MNTGKASYSACHEHELVIKRKEDRQKEKKEGGKEEGNLFKDSC